MIKQMFLFLFSVLIVFSGSSCIQTKTEKTRTERTTIRRGNTEKTRTQRTIIRRGNTEVDVIAPKEYSISVSPDGRRTVIKSPTMETKVTPKKTEDASMSSDIIKAKRHAFIRVLMGKKELKGLP